jgi:hypothetical protein
MTLHPIPPISLIFEENFLFFFISAGTEDWTKKIGYSRGVYLEDMVYGYLRLGL